MPQENENEHPEIDVISGNHELIIRNRYKFYYNVNDVLIAVWFIIGSTLFFWKETETIAIWFFLFGSIELLIRPVIIPGNDHSILKMMVKYLYRAPLY